MRQYNKYLVSDTDQFDPGSFPFIDDEIAAINSQIKHLPTTFRSEIMVSFLKDHFLQNDWVTGNPALTELVASGTLFTGSIESLFDSTRDNLAFRQHLELYLLKRFAEA